MRWFTCSSKSNSSIAAAILATALANAALAGNPVADHEAHHGAHENVASATGEGRFLVGGELDVKFAFSARQHADGSASGHTHHVADYEGKVVDFDGEVTCVSVDAESGRAWIGGVVTENRSTHPSFTAERNQKGRDIWFRVLDNGEGDEVEPDRSTFVGFDGDAGIVTSAEYCEVKTWPDDNARTHPVVEGDISARP